MFPGRMDINQSGLLLLTRLLPTLDEIGSQEAGDDNSRPEHGVMPGFRIEVRSAPYRAARGHSHEEGGTLSSGIYHPPITLTPYDSDCKIGVTYKFRHLNRVA